MPYATAKSSGKRHRPSNGTAPVTHAAGPPMSGRRPTQRFHLAAAAACSVLLLAHVRGSPPGYVGAARQLHAPFGSWIVTALGPGNPVDIDVVDADHAWAITASQTWARDGADWHIVPNPGQRGDVLTSLYARDAEHAWVGGWRSTEVDGVACDCGFLWRWDNGAWVVDQPVIPLRLLAVALPADDFGLVIGQAGVPGGARSFAWNGAHWLPVAFPGHGSQLAVASAASAWAIDTSDGALVRFADGAWTSWPLEDAPSLDDIEVAGDDFGVLFGQGGVIRHWDGAAWHAVESPVEMRALDIALASASDGWATSAAALLHWDGNDWIIVDRQGAVTIRRLDVAAPDVGWGVDQRQFVRYDPLVPGGISGTFTPTPLHSATPPATPTALPTFTPTPTVDPFVVPTWTSTPTFTPDPSETPGPSPTPGTPTPSVTPRPTWTLSPTPSPGPSPTPLPTSTHDPASPTVLASPTPTPTVTASGTSSALPSDTATHTATATATAPAPATSTASVLPTISPTISPAVSATITPTITPTTPISPTTTVLATVTPTEPVSPTAPSPTTVLSLRASNFVFSPSVVSVRASKPISIVLHNDIGTHDIVVDLGGGEFARAPVAAGSQTTGVRFTAPAAPGTYNFYCSVGIHRSLGMLGRLVVTTDGVPPASPTAASSPTSTPLATASPPPTTGATVTTDATVTPDASGTSHPDATSTPLATPPPIASATDAPSPTDFPTTDAGPSATRSPSPSGPPTTAPTAPPTAMPSPPRTITSAPTPTPTPAPSSTGTPRPSPSASPTDPPLEPSATPRRPGGSATIVFLPIAQRRAMIGLDWP